jgi:endonuclease/exonuclease/phosphatase family metal-dependent hydrolase
MKRLITWFMSLSVMGGFGWHYLQEQTGIKLDLGKIVSSVSSSSSPSVTTSSNPSAPRAAPGETIRVASFNIQVFGEQKLDKPAVMNVLAHVVRMFDVVAIQEVRAKTQDVLPRFVSQINAEGGHYDFALGPRMGRSVSKEQYAFIFNTDTIDIDRESVYTVGDPQNLMQRAPMVAAFRARGPPPNEAFTFTLVDVHTEPDQAVHECDVMADVYRAVQNDGRREDDIIVLGDFNEDDHHIGRLGQLPYMLCTISGVPSNVRGTKLYDNIIFDSRATTEFTGRSGVLNLMSQFQLSMADALEVSDHNPVWAEFSVREGGRPGQMASGPAAPAR